MTANVSSFPQNFPAEKKPVEFVEKDIRKWVESVVEFKANLDKQKKEPPLEKHLKKVKKFKVKKKPSLVAVQMGSTKNSISGQRKNLKTKKIIKKSSQLGSEKARKKETPQTADVFEEIKEAYRNIKLPQNWTSGLSSGRLVFNRIKITTYNSQQKIVVERSLVITKDRNIHVLINGTEIALTNWELQKVDKIDDVKKAIKDIDSLKICEGPTNGPKSPQCSLVVDSKLKTCQACKFETDNPQKSVTKKPRATKKPAAAKKLSKQQSFQT